MPQDRENKVTVSTRLTVSMRDRVNAFTEESGHKGTEVFEAALAMFLDTVEEMERVTPGWSYKAQGDRVKDAVEWNRLMRVLNEILVTTVFAFRQAGIAKEEGEMHPSESLIVAFTEYWASRNAIDAWESVTGKSVFRNLLIRGLEEPKTPALGLVKYPLYLMSHFLMLYELADSEEKISEETKVRVERIVDEWKKRATSLQKVAKPGVTLKEMIKEMKDLWKDPEVDLEDPPE